MSDFSALSARSQTIRRLRQALRRWDGAECRDDEGDDGLEIPEWEPLPSRLLPRGQSGSILELVGSDPAAITLAVWLAARRGGQVVLIDPAGRLFPGALPLLGLDPRSVVIVRPEDWRLAVWAAEQSLRCPGVAATLCRLGPRLGTVASRRLKLAAEAGGGVGLVVRSAAREPPFADARWLVRPVLSEATETLRPRWEVEAVYVRGGTEDTRCILELTNDARLVLAPAELARSAGSRFRASG